MSNGVPLLKSLEELARSQVAEYARGTFEGHVLEVTWDPDLQYNYRWDGEVVSYGKALEYLRHE